MKNFLKKIIFIFTFTVFSFCCNAQTIINPEIDDPNFYYTIGEFNVLVNSGTKVNVLGYVRKHHILNKNDYQQKENTFIKPKKYRYELILISKSTYQSELTSTWLYGVNIFVNNINITIYDYPENNYNLLIKTTPTQVYWMETDEEMVLIEIKWGNAIYDPKNIK